jgi:hypothetical protein
MQGFDLYLELSQNNFTVLAENNAANFFCLINCQEVFNRAGIG